MNNKSVSELCENSSNLNKLPKDILCKLIMLVRQETIDEMERKTIKVHGTDVTEKEVINFVKDHPYALGCCSKCHVIDYSLYDAPMDGYFSYCLFCVSLGGTVLCEKCFNKDDNIDVTRSCSLCKESACSSHLETKICILCEIDFETCPDCKYNSSCLTCQ